MGEMGIRLPIGRSIGFILLIPPVSPSPLYFLLAPRFFRLEIDVEERRLADAGDVARLRHGEIDAVDQKARRALVPVRSRFVF